MNKNKLLLFGLIILCLIFMSVLYIAYKGSFVNNNGDIQKSNINASEGLLRASKSDGVYLVGFDIDRGKWISEKGYGDACYWVRRKYDAIVRGEYYGASGGVMEIVDGDYEVEMRGCGVWTYIGE